MSPWESPGAFSILSYIEQAYGVYHIKGGIYKLTESMAEVGREIGVEIRGNFSVKKIETEGRNIRGFNLGYQLAPMLAFRPRNKFEELDQCWLVGGGTHPGSGLPIILESARITANCILLQDKLPLHEVKPLPDVSFDLKNNNMPKKVIPI